MTSRSTDAIQVTKSVCDERFRGRYVLEVIDLYRQPDAAPDGEFLAAPMLERIRPLPRIRLVGNLSRNRVLAALTRPEH